MLVLRTVQAEYGDCLLLTFGTRRRPRHILVDGGEETTYPRRLRPLLETIAGNGGALDLVILTHVDNDHITGLLDLFTDLLARQGNGRTPLIPVRALWHNQFSQTIGRRRDLTAGLERLLAGNGARAMVQSRAVLAGIAEGHSLAGSAHRLGVPINPGFARGRIVAEESPAPVVLANLRLQVVGPTRSALDRLRRQWRDWLRRHGGAIALGDPVLTASADRSVPNLSSIMVLAEAHGRRVLLSGDGLASHLLQGLERAGLLDEHGAIDVDVFKLPHHGSARNASRRLFERIRARCYVISANGRDGNPDFETLDWMVSAARERGDAIEILATNPTPSLDRLTAERPAARWGYRLRVLAPGEPALEIDLSP